MEIKCAVKLLTLILRNLVTGQQRRITATVATQAQVEREDFEDQRLTVQLRNGEKEKAAKFRQDFSSSASMFHRI